MTTIKIHQKDPSHLILFYPPLIKLIHVVQKISLLNQGGQNFFLVLEIYLSSQPRSQWVPDFNRSRGNWSAIMLTTNFSIRRRPRVKKLRVPMRSNFKNPWRGADNVVTTQKNLYSRLQTFFWLVQLKICGTQNFWYFRIFTVVLGFIQIRRFPQKWYSIWYPPKNNEKSKYELWV